MEPNYINRVWIVDDDAVYRYAFRKFVEMKGLCPEVVDFGSGIHAIDFLKNPINANKLPDLIFLDIDMPTMDGWGFIEAFESIQANFKKTPSIYLVTSSIAYTDIVKAQNHPAIIDYIMKPVDSKKFSLLFSEYVVKQSAYL
ncbi:response regulator [Mucilaginibacter lutimaris]|uniref:Response regulator n=1 Tax=Mucilaginibacter lutimaris TaxID=931629 RepID=A0ABW2ZKV3_9SPHI